MTTRWMLATLSTAAVLSAAGCQSKEDKLYEAVEQLCEHAQEFEGTNDPFEPALEELEARKAADQEAIDRLWSLRNDVSIKERWGKLVEAMDGRSPACKVVENAWKRRAPKIELTEFEDLCARASEDDRPETVERALYVWPRGYLDPATRQVWEAIESSPRSGRWKELVKELAARGFKYSCPPLERYWSVSEPQ